MMVKIKMNINVPYGYCLLPSNVNNRQGTPGPSVFGNGIDYVNCVPKIVQTPEVIGPQNTASVNILDSYFFKGASNPAGYSNFEPKEYSDTSLQSERPLEPNINYYTEIAGKSLNVRPDLLMNVFFSDDNINHLRKIVVKKVKEITAESGITGSLEGVDIKTPSMDDFFYYMVNIYQNYKIHNGSICFVNLKKQTDIQQEISKLNTDTLQDYVSKMISQINMYIYYYRDASQLPEQLSLPAYNSMKGSKSLEYNLGFKSGNPIGVASYNEATNII
jgi:hypothetical protein